MLSVLIPVYNYHVVRLVEDLHQQAMDTFVDFEIIVIEDGSTQFLEENRTVGNLVNCNYSVLEKNVGRATVRNLLADKAKYNHLLFLDCDALIPNQSFINKYLSFCHEEIVVLGGRIYQDCKDPKYSLLRKYGENKERNSLTNEEQRKKFPMFTTPNFLISKKIFDKVRFDENIVGYGHEDSVFGIHLQRLGVTYNFIDNPVIHIGLETNDVFLEKTENALENLYELYLSGKYKELETQSKLLSFYLKLNKYKLSRFTSFLYVVFGRMLKKHLIGKNPSLFLFDLYKLLYFASSVHNK